MPKLLKIGIAGCGAIGSSLARAIVSDFGAKAKLIGLYDTNVNKSRELSVKLKNRGLVFLDLDSLIKKSNFLIEATNATCAFDIARKAVLFSRDIMVMSVGGLLRHKKKLESLAQKNNARVFIPSGAICGIDGLKAAMRGKVSRVTLTTIKHPRAFSGNAYVSRRKIRLDNIKKDKVIFKGDALSAVRFFPQNINVAATLSLAGIGPKNTCVRIVASPSIKINIHRIEVVSDSGKIFSRTENVVHPDNPKTSYLAVLSAVATLKQVLEPLRIGT